MKNLQGLSPEKDTFDEKIIEYVLWDRSHPKSLLNLLPEKIAEPIEKRYQENPDLFFMDEHTLNKFLCENNQKPSPTDNRLRLKFWLEFDRVHALGLNKMNVSNIIAGITSRETFGGRYLARENKVAWLVLPPANYGVKIMEALEFGLEQMRDILGEDHAPEGRLNVKLAGLKVAIVKMLDDRLHGMPTQNVNQKNLHYNLNRGRKEVGELGQAITEEEILKRIAEAEARERASLHLPPEQAETRDLVPVEVTKDE